MAEASIAQPPPAQERRQGIAAGLGGTAAGHFVPFRGSYITAPVASVPDHLLLYRADNGRLIAELETLLRQQGLDWSQWRQVQESQETQQQLHALLIAKARDPLGPIFQELERQGQQTEPLLVTAEGVVVNGNRRLAAMRELRHRDPGRYEAFAALQVAVLPAEVEPADLEFIEAALQMAPETKLAYGWINRRLKLRRQRDELGLPVEAICEAYRLEGAEQLDREVAELALAEDYLENFREAPGQYDLVGDAEALFVGLREQLAALPKALRGHWRLAGFTLIDGRAAVQGPLERHFPFVEPIPEQMPTQALRRFAQERELTGPSGEGEDERPPDAELGQDLDLVLGEPGHSERNARLLFEVMESLRAEHHERRAPARVLARIRKAKEMLDRLEPDSLSDKQRRRLRGDLAALQAQAAFLLGEGEAPREEGVIDRLYRKLRA